MYATGATALVTLQGSAPRTSVPTEAMAAPEVATAVTVVATAAEAERNATSATASVTLHASARKKTVATDAAA